MRDRNLAASKTNYFLFVCDRRGPTNVGGFAGELSRLQRRKADRVLSEGERRASSEQGAWMEPVRTGGSFMESLVAVIV